MFYMYKQILFFLELSYIISSEIFLYLLFQDYLKFIRNITHRLASVNILYVKIFQAIASNNNLIDEKMNNELLTFTDKAPWNFSDIRFDELIELVDKYDLIIENSFEKPMNSGMISLVYKGIRKSDKKPIIIKMKRNNIENKLNDAIENLKAFMYLLSFIPIVHKYKISNIIHKNIEIIYQQTNFHKEVQNIQLIKKNCKNLKYIKIPDVSFEATKENPNFIIMEYIDGMKINEIDEADYYDFSKQVLKFCFTTTLLHGVSHGDLHSGNILFIKDEKDEKYKYKIGIIDFGILYEMDKEYSNMLFEFFSNVFDISPKDSVIFLLNSSMIEPPNIIQQIPKEHYDVIVNFGTEILSDVLDGSKKANQLQLYEFLVKMNDYLNKPQLSKYGIRPSDHFIKMQFVLAMVHGVNFTLCKDNMIPMFNEVLSELFHINFIID